MTNPTGNSRQAICDELLRLGQIAAGILDGEEAKGIITPQAMHWIAHPDPSHIFLSGDYYDVDHQTFLRFKRLLLRLERLAKVEVNSSLWVVIPGGEQVTVAVHNGVHHRYYRFGQERLDTPAEMKEVLQTGQVRAAPPSSDQSNVTVLAPVFDSLGAVSAVLELTAPLESHGPAWS